MFARKMILGALSTALVAVALAGCGSSPAAPDPNAIDPNAGVDPTGGYGAPTTGLPATSPYGAPTTTAGPAPQLAELTASVTTKHHSLLSKFTCTVQVTNSSSVPRTGKVTVTFVHSGKAESGSPAQTQTVSVPANGTQNVDFKDNKWHILSEDATVDVQTDPVPTAAGLPAATGYGAPAASGH